MDASAEDNMQAAVIDINEMRRRVADGDPVSDAELRGALQRLRQSRAAAAVGKAKKTAAKKKAAEPLDLNSLFDK